MVWSWRWRGACAALVWDGRTGVYRCGALVRVQAWPFLVRLVRRWIGAGQGCDCSWEPTAMASSNALDRTEQEQQHGSQ